MECGKDNEEQDAIVAMEVDEKNETEENMANDCVRLYQETQDGETQDSPSASASMTSLQTPVPVPKRLQDVGNSSEPSLSTIDGTPSSLFSTPLQKKHHSVIDLSLYPNSDRTPPRPIGYSEIADIVDAFLEKEVRKDESLSVPLPLVLQEEEKLTVAGEKNHAWVALGQALLLDKLASNPISEIKTFFVNLLSCSVGLVNCIVTSFGLPKDNKAHEDLIFPSVCFQELQTSEVGMCYHHSGFCKTADYINFCFGWYEKCQDFCEQNSPVPTNICCVKDLFHIVAILYNRPIVLLHREGKLRGYVVVIYAYGSEHLLPEKVVEAIEEEKPQIKTMEFGAGMELFLPSCMWKYNSNHLTMETDGDRNFKVSRRIFIA